MIVRKKLLTLVLLASNGFVGMICTESYYDLSFLEKLKNCVDNRSEDKCKEMILHTERIQLREYYEGNLKCQTSILGLQTELIRNIYFDREKNNEYGKTIPYLIKNC